MSPLAFHVDGATEPEKRRGVEAAERFFRAAGVTPFEAARAAFRRQAWDVESFAPEVATGGPVPQAKALVIYERVEGFFLERLTAGKACFHSLLNSIPIVGMNSNFSDFLRFSQL